MKLNRMKPTLKKSGLLFGILLAFFGAVAPALPMFGSVAYAQSCPNQNIPNNMPAIGICLTQSGNQVTSASGYTVTVQQTLGTQTNKIATTFVGSLGLFVTNSTIAPVGSQCATGTNTAPYKLEITVTKGGVTSKTPDDTCNDGGINIFPISIAAPTAQTKQAYGSVSGCISYKAPDGTTQPYNGSANAQGAPATATITGPSGPNSTSITNNLDANGCLTGQQIANLPVGAYSLSAVYEAGLTPNGNVGTVTYKQNFTIAANQNTKIGNYSGVAASTSDCGSTDTGGNCTLNDSNTLNCTAGGSLLSTALNWIMCPALNLAWGAANLFDGFITRELDVDVTPIFDTSTPSGEGYYTAWNSFRILATAILVIAGLIMVVSQAFGFEFLDAYTTRKILPRLLVAIIGISLSWPLMSLVVQFFDTAGIDIRALMYAPFEHIATHISLTTGILTSIGVGATIFALGFASLTFLGTAALAALVGFMILVIRQIAIIMLVILAPIAIACYILPGTHKVWKLWYDNFLGLMLMFPIISALIAAGHIFSAVTTTPNSGGESSGVIAQAIGLVAYFAPYFLLPMAARMATGIIGNLAGFVNDRHRGAFDRLKGARGNAMQKNMANMQAGTRFNNGALNALTARATTRNFGLGNRGREAYDNKMAIAAGEFAKSKHGMATQFKDDTLWAKSFKSANEAEEGLKEMGWEQGRVDKAIAGAKASGGFGASQQVWATKQLAATGTGYKNEAEMLATIARVSGNNDVLGESMWGEMRGLSERAGRNDLKAGYGTGAAILGQIRAENASSGTAMTATQVERQMSAQMQDFSLEAARGADNHTIMGRNKPKSIENMMKRMQESQVRYAEIATDTSGTYTPGQVRQAQVALGEIRAKMENMEGYKSYGPEVNSEALHGTYEAVPGASGPGDIRLTGERKAGGYEAAHETVVGTTTYVDGPATTAYGQQRAGHVNPEDVLNQSGDHEK